MTNKLVSVAEALDGVFSKMESRWRGTEVATKDVVVHLEFCVKLSFLEVMEDCRGGNMMRSRVYSQMHYI